MGIGAARGGERASRRCHRASCVKTSKSKSGMRRVNTTRSPDGEMNGKLSHSVVSTLI